MAWESGEADVTCWYTCTNGALYHPHTYVQVKNGSGNVQETHFSYLLSLKKARTIIYAHG